MSEQVLDSNKGDEGDSKKPTHAYRSAWMARWARTGVEPAVQGYGFSSLKEHLGCSNEFSLATGPKTEFGDSVSTERFRGVFECRGANTVEENVEEKHQEKPGNEKRDILPFPMFNISQRTDGVAASSNEELQPYSRMETSSKKRSSLLGSDMLDGLWTKSHELPGKNTLAASLSSFDVIGSSSKAVGNKRPRMQETNALSTPKLRCQKNMSFPCQQRSDHNPMDLTRSVRVYAAVNPDQGTSRVPYSLPQAAHHFLFTKKTNVNLSEDVQLLRKSTVSMKLKGKLFNGFPHLFPDLHIRHQEQVRPLPLGSSKDSEGLENIDEVKNSAVCIKNESSAETDIMEMDNFPRNHLYGSNSYSSTKVKERENQSALQTTEIPDMNQEPPVVSDMGNTLDGHGEETSPSKTESMNVEDFIPNTKSPTECYHREPEPEPESELSSTWIKRLKISVLDAGGHGTKIMKMEDSPHDEKVNDFFLEITKRKIANPEIRNQQPSTSEIKSPTPRNEEITLKHAWIQRWCRNNAMASYQPPELEVRCEAALNPKGKALEEIPKKQFPSIGAMALMGKALSGFSPSGLRKTGSTIVWNTQDLR